MIKLINDRPEMHDPHTAVKRLEMVIDDERTLDEMLDAYKDFLLAMGYLVNGNIVVEPYED
jgi:hypothetical protein